MEGGDENRKNVDHSMGVAGGSRDPMQKSMKRNSENGDREALEDEEIELSLGLSTNGRFGVDPKRKKLLRSSSVANVVVANNYVGNGSNPQAREAAVGSDAPLVRATSMPSDTQERCRGEELQPAGSMEKLKNVVLVNENENCSEDVGGSGLHAGSIGVSDLQGQMVKEATQNPTMEASSSRQFPPQPVPENVGVTAADPVVVDEESLQNEMFKMPYVSIKGFEPNDDQVRGFLFRYKTGENLKIVCVCHGLFLTPAEFIKHGGGADVADPLRHIVVNPFPLC